ncbi:MAG: glycosyltransferase family 4 protein, partial [Arachnia sp.]
ITISDGNTPISIIGVDQLPQVLNRIRELRIPTLAHSPTPVVSSLLQDKLFGSQLAVWYHGYEVRDYRRLLCNFDSDTLAFTRQLRDDTNAQRFEAAAPLFQDPSITKVFVSDFQRHLAEWDVGKSAVNAHIIPNHIDTELYQGRVRRPEEAKKILLLRSFAERNYANDVALRAIAILSQRRGFDELEITIRGFGNYFDAEVERVRDFKNVVVEKAYSSAVEMAMLHYDHGVFLCPSRFDTQGVMLGEAMASGMVTITNPVAAIPEYTDETCSLLPRTDDPWAFADALWHLVTHPELMPVLSRNASERVTRQCGLETTIGREIAIIRSLGA